MPNLSLATQSYNEVLARGRKCERCDRRSEGEVVDGDPTLDIGKNRMAIFVNGEEEVALGCEADAGNVFAVGKGQSMGFVAGNSS